MKIAIVGGGFAGLLAAYKLADKGYDVELFEEHRRVGYPQHCTGLVSWSVVEGIGDPARESIESRYHGLTLNVMGSECRINTRDIIVKLDRVKLEEELLEYASSTGAKVRLGVRVGGVSVEGGLRIGSNRKVYDLVVLAEGLHGKLRKSLGLIEEPLTSLGVNIEANNITHYDSSYFEVLFFKDYAGFAWIVPKSNSIVVGALSLKPGEAVRKARELLELKESTRIKIYGGRVIHGPPLVDSIIGKVSVIGDAAALNKPLTGGGLWPNTLLINEWLNGMERGLSITDSLNNAYKLVVKKLLEQYRIARVFYRVDRHQRNRGLKILRTLLEEDLCNTLNGRISYDEHEKLLNIIMRSPTLFFKGFFSIILSPGLFKKILFG